MDGRIFAYALHFPHLVSAFRGAEQQSTSTLRGTALIRDIAWQYVVIGWMDGSMNA